MPCGWCAHRDVPGPQPFSKDLMHIFSLKQNIQRVRPARSGIQGSARSLPSTSGSLSLAEPSSCTAGEGGGRERGRETPMRCHGGKARAEMGTAFRDAVVGGLAPRLLAWAGTGLLGMRPGRCRLGWAMDRAGFPDGRLSNSVLKMSHWLRRLSRSWDSLL